MTDKTPVRRVVAWANVSLDGCTGGPRGPQHDAWLYEHAVHDQTGAYFESIWRGADTALIGRANYEGFYSVWPGITRHPDTDDRTRALGQWLDSVEKVVFSRTLTEARWENTRIAADLETTVKELKTAPGRDILVLNSASIIQALLRTGLVDDLRIAVVPTILGGGRRLFTDDLPQSTWRLAETTTLAHGAVGLHYQA